MKKIWFVTTINALAFFLTTTSAGAIEEIYRKGKDTPEQKSKELDDLERSLDAQIQQTALKIEQLQVLKQFKQLNLSPQQTYFNFDPSGQTIEMTEYNFGTIAPRPDVSPTVFSVKNMKIFFNGSKLKRIECQLTKMSLDKAEKSLSSITHVNPTTEPPNNITIVKNFNATDIYTVKVGDMENTKTNPFRISFKKDFYLAHLQQFEDQLKQTFELHRKKASDRDQKTINHLKGKSGY